jgi:hypothetical protein
MGSLLGSGGGRRRACGAVRALRAARRHGGRAAGRRDGSARRDGERCGQPRQAVLDTRHRSTWRRATRRSEVLTARTLVREPVAVDSRPTDARSPRSRRQGHRRRVAASVPPAGTDADTGAISAGRSRHRPGRRHRAASPPRARPSVHSPAAGGGQVPHSSAGSPPCQDPEETACGRAHAPAALLPRAQRPLHARGPRGDARGLSAGRAHRRVPGREPVRRPRPQRRRDAPVPAARPGLSRRRHDLQRPVRLPAAGRQRAGPRHPVARTADLGPKRITAPPCWSSR